MVSAVAAFLGASFGVLSLLHVAWALGVRVGHAQVLPERDGKPLFRPGPVSTLTVAGLLFLSALLVLQRAGIVTLVLPDALVGPGCWVVSAALLLRAIGEFRYVGFFKRVRGTAFARMDTRLYSPLALLLGAGTGLVAYLAP